MKIIKTANYKKQENLNIKIFDGENYNEILTAFKNLPKNKYEMEMFEMIGNKGIALLFDNNLHIKMANENRNKFEEYFNIKTSDHVLVSFKKKDKKLKRNEEPLHSLDIHCDGEDDGY